MNKKNIIIVLVILLSFIYSVIFKNYYKSINTVNKSININNDIMTIDKIYNFVLDTNLEQIELLKMEFNNIKEISNQAKLNLAFHYLNKNLDFKKGVSSKLFDEYLVKVFGSNIHVKHETIKLINYDIKIIYDEKNDIYMSEKDVLEQDINIYNKLIDFEYKNNKYYLKQYKFYIKDNNVYKSFGDYNNDIDVLIKLDNIENLEKDINQNLNKFEKNLYTYTYVFSKRNGDIILEKYYKN